MPGPATSLAGRTRVALSSRARPASTPLRAPAYERESRECAAFGGLVACGPGLGYRQESRESVSRTRHCCPAASAVSMRAHAATLSGREPGRVEEWGYKRVGSDVVVRESRERCDAKAGEAVRRIASQTAEPVLSHGWRRDVLSLPAPQPG